MAFDPIRKQAERRPHATAIATPDGELSWEALDGQVEAAAQSLVKAGATPDDVVALQATTELSTLAVIFGAWRSGISVAPLHPRLTEAEREGALAALDAFEPGQEPDRPATAAIVWTSGSTGTPRGVALPFRSFEHNAQATARRLSLVSADRWLTSLSLAHVGGLALIARAASLGSTLVLTDGFSARDFHQQCSDGHVTHTSLVPTMLARLVALGTPAPSSLLVVLLGGAAAAPSLVTRAMELGYPVALTYGMTEAGSQVATATPAQSQAHPDAVGTALDGVEVAIAESGRIVVRGPTLATHTLGGVGLNLDEDGWLHTGDFGSLDENGVLRVGGRLDDRIISGGVNVDPVEVERALMQLSTVESACVVGMDDPEWGQRVEAVLTLVNPEGPGPTIEGIRDQLRERLSVAKLPRRVHIVSQMPLRRGGKVDRSRVREILIESA